MKNKHILVLFIVGLMIDVIGAIFKMYHLEIFGAFTANHLLIIGMAVKFIACVLFIIKLLRNKRVKAFLNE